MTTVQDFLQAMEAYAPANLQESWDNVGLLCGDRSTPVQRVLVALDPFEAVIDEAIALNCQVIVTHHPLIFTPVKVITEDNPSGRCIRKLITHNIAAINAHTNLDKVQGGVNDVLAAKLGLQNCSIIRTEGLDAKGQPYGLLRMGTVEAQNLDSFLNTVKTALACPGLRYTDTGKPVQRVAVGGGACGSEWHEALEAGCDTFVTADVKYNQFWDAQDAGINLIDAGHFYTENPVCAVLAERISAACPESEVILSKIHRDICRFF